jgi:hypothetical protein
MSKNIRKRESPVVSECDFMHASPTLGKMPPCVPSALLCGNQKMRKRYFRKNIFDTYGAPLQCSEIITSWVALPKLSKKSDIIFHPLSNAMTCLKAISTLCSSGDHMSQRKQFRLSERGHFGDRINLPGKSGLDIEASVIPSKSERTLISS